ncbi:unnamed protein product [Closterium sp. NIES-65]|nr:unnamed protein product [Closterium sp. NIES-65]
MVYGYQSIPTGNSSEQLLGRFVAEEKARRLQEGSDSSQSPGACSSSKFFTIPWTNLLVAASKFFTIPWTNVLVGTCGMSRPSKFFTIPWTNVLVGGGLRFGRQSLIDALKASLQRLGMERVDLYQIHFPFPTISNATLMDGLKQAHAEGLATAVGVSNYNTQQKAHSLLRAARWLLDQSNSHPSAPFLIPADPPTNTPAPLSSHQLQEAHSLLKAASIPLASNQVKFKRARWALGDAGGGRVGGCGEGGEWGDAGRGASGGSRGRVTDTGDNSHRALQHIAPAYWTEDLQVSLIAYSPLASGLLTDKALTRSDKDAVRCLPVPYSPLATGLLTDKDLTRSGKDAVRESGDGSRGKRE